MTATRIWICFILMMWLLLGMAAIVHAHDAAHPELDHWFMSLKGRHGIPCCDGADATHLSNVDWESRDGHYRVRLNGNWVDVPENAVVDGPNLSGSTLVWPYYINGELIGIRCFMVGAMG